MNYNNGYGSTYDTNYGSSVPYGVYDSTGIDLTAYTPMGMLKNQLWCMAVGIIVFMILMWILSKVPIIGPWLSSTIKYSITKLAEFVGVLNCGFENDFDNLLEVEKKTYTKYKY